MFIQQNLLRMRYVSIILVMKLNVWLILIH